MTTFYLTQRVRKARGNRNVGITGAVAAFDPNDPIGCTLGVRHDVAVDGFNVRLEDPVRMAAGELVWGSPDDYEPIVPGGLEAPEQIASLFEPDTREVTA